MQQRIFLILVIAIVLSVSTTVATAETKKAENQTWKNHLDLIRMFEGLYLQVGRDIDDSPIIGYGLNLSAHPHYLEKVLNMSVSRRKGILDGLFLITPEEANQLLIYKTTELQGWIFSRIEGFDKLKPKAQVALISAAYNSPRLVGPRLRSFVSNGKHLSAAIEIAYGNRFVPELPGLQKRRTIEAAFYVEGQLRMVVEFPVAKSQEQHWEWYDLALRMAGGGFPVDSIVSRITDSE